MSSNRALSRPTQKYVSRLGCAHSGRLGILRIRSRRTPSLDIEVHCDSAMRFRFFPRMVFWLFPSIAGSTCFECKHASRCDGMSDEPELATRTKLEGRTEFLPVQTPFGQHSGNIQVALLRMKILGEIVGTKVKRERG